MAYVCVSCGKAVLPRFMERRWQKGHCSCYQIRQDDERDADQKEYKRLLARMGIVGANRSYLLANYDPRCKLDTDTAHNRKIWNRLGVYTHNLANALVHGDMSLMPKRNVVLASSQPGVGKTMLMAGIANALVQEALAVRAEQRWGPTTQIAVDRLSNVRWFLATDLNPIRLEKDEYDNSGTRFKVLLKRAVWLIDDVGKEHFKEVAWRHQLWWEIMEYRTTQQIPTIITTNLDVAGLRAHMGDFAFDRLCESGLYLDVRGESHRFGGMEPILDDEEEDTEEPTPLRTREAQPRLLAGKVRA